MHLFKADTSFEFEFRRVLSHARYRGADVSEVLQLLDVVQAGDMESWHNAFLGLAQRVEAAASDINPASMSRSQRVSMIDRLLAASNYYRATDFFLHGHPNDPRINDMWTKQTTCFDRALELLGNGTRCTLQADNFKIPIIYFKAPQGEDLAYPRPTLIAGNGYDGAMEELLHVCGFAALDRGYNLIVYEGPGQCTVRREQGLGFIHEWERVVTPVVDFAVKQPEVDANCIALFGYSLGGYLSVRAAAFEPRIAAVLAIDGVFDFSKALQPPSNLAKILESGDIYGFDKAYLERAYDPKTSTQERWSLQQGLWAFKTNKVSELLERMRAFNLETVIQQVQCPVFVGDAQEDIFFKGQPELVAAALGDKATLRIFTTAEGAGAHCQAGAAVLLNSEIFDWLDEKLVKA